MTKDEELERIRSKKLSELKKKTLKDEETFPIQKGSPIVITDATFMNIIHNHPLVIIDCWAAWCAPCHMIAPIIEELARDYAGKIVFCKLNVDENKKTSMQHQIMSIPTLLVF